MPTKNILLIVLSFLIGVSWASFFFWPLVKFGFLILASFPLIFYIFCKRNFLLFISLCLLFCALGIFRFEIDSNNNKYLFLDNRIGQEISQEAIIVDFPDRRDNKVFLIAKVIEGEKETKVKITTRKNNKFSYGDLILIKGKLQSINNFKNNQGRIFDYQNFLAKDEIFYQFYFPEITLLKESVLTHNPKHYLFLAKNFLITKINQALPRPESSLLSGLLIGNKEALGTELLDKFNRAGISHIVVLSGYNATIIADSIIRISSFLPLIYSSGLSIFLIILFIILTGAGPTIVRAGIMAILVILSRVLKRENDIFRYLLISAFLMILVNPYILIFDLGFALSFLATLGLIYLTPILEKKMTFIPESFSLRLIFAATISTQIFVFPLLLFKIGSISLIAPISNLLILIFIPLTMLFGFLMFLIFSFSTILALPLIFLTFFLLKYEIFIVELTSSFPGANLEFNLSGYLVILFYFILSILIWKKTNLISKS